MANIKRVDMDMIREQDLIVNGGERIPVCLCLDTSGSMLTVTGGKGTGKYVNIDGQRYELASGGTSRLSTLQKGIESFYDAVYKEPMARYSAELAIVTFDDTARVLSDFARVEYEIDGVKTRQNAPKLETHGNTSLGAGLNLALKILNERKESYKSAGVDYYQPWLVLMTDGVDNGTAAELNKARQDIQKLVSENKLSVFPFFISEEEDEEAKLGMRTLASVSPNQEPLRIGVEQMDGLFRWLGKSVVAASSGDLDGGQALPNLRDFIVKPWNAPFAG